MRTFIVAIALLLTIIATSLTLSACADKRLNDLLYLTEQALEEGELNERSRKCIDAISKEWEKNESLFHITINREEMIAVKKEIASALGASEADSRENFLIAAEKLCITIDNIKGYTELRIENVF